jgi:geranylgeranyl diphosphate synthase type II
LLGDLLLSDVHQIFARLDVSSVTRVRLLDALAHTIMDSVAGELTDVGLSDRIIAPSIAVVQDMCGRKTATYTFEFPLRAAAALQGSSVATENVLTKVGQRLGLAFQLRDDYLSTFGDPELHGKDAFSDLREGKETAAIAYARTMPQWSLIQELFEDRDLREERAHEIHALLVDAGADRFVAELINEQMAEFEALLDEHQELVPAEARQTLRDLVQELEGRNA